MTVKNDGRSLVKDFVTQLNRIDNTKSAYEKFDDFLTMGYCALAKTTATPRRGEELEQQYMDVVARYRNKDDVRKMPNLLSLTYLGIQERMDFLGTVAGELGSLDARLGQFFTPYEISRLMVEMTMSDAEKLIIERGYIRVSEPAVGAGGMILAMADFMESKGLNPSTSLWVEAVDVARLPFYMAFIQLAARGLSGNVIWGNSLSNEVYSGATLPATFQFYRKHGAPSINDNGGEGAGAPPMMIRSEGGQYELL